MADGTLCFIAAFAAAALPGSFIIRTMTRLKAGQNTNADAPKSHAAKQGTPTMGGVLILFSAGLVGAAIFLLTQLGAHREAALDYMLPAVMLLTLGFGSIGFIDDYLSIRRGTNLGLRAREKFLAQFIVAALFVAWLAANETGITKIIELLPSFTWGATTTFAIHVPLGSAYYALAVVLIVGLSNATNFTDGLDGLCGGVTVIVSMALAALVARSEFGVGLYALTIAGAAAGFLWFNAYPARIFMGDTGSLAIGAALAGIALVGKQEMGLIVATLVFWAEIISVIIQVLVFKWRRRTKSLEYAQKHRVFRRTPLHHHFEEGGMPETRVVTRFWIAAGLCAGVALLWSRG